jgi:hypothetical protein
VVICLSAFGGEIAPRHGSVVRIWKWVNVEMIQFGNLEMIQFGNGVNVIIWKWVNLEIG